VAEGVVVGNRGPACSLPASRSAHSQCFTAPSEPVLLLLAEKRRTDPFPPVPSPVLPTLPRTRSRSLSPSFSPSPCRPTPTPPLPRPSSPRSRTRRRPASASRARPHSTTRAASPTAASASSRSSARASRSDARARAAVETTWCVERCLRDLAREVVALGRSSLDHHEHALMQVILSLQNIPPEQGGNARTEGSHASHFDGVPAGEDKDSWLAKTQPGQSASLSLCSPRALHREADGDDGRARSQPERQVERDGGHDRRAQGRQASARGAVSAGRRGATAA